MENHFKLFTTEISIFENLDRAAEMLNSGARSFILTDDNVERLWLTKLKNYISSENTTEMIIPAGEKSKNRDILFSILDRLAAEKFTRNDVFIAFGGGVVSDIGALAAGLFMRGMRLVIIPTTLLAMVDASIGEKTAIDTVYSKNTIGMFYRPEKIIMSMEFLSTLSDDEKREGMAEVIKTGLLAGGELSQKLLSGNYNIFDIVSLCVSYKISVVERDEFDCGERHILNLGHTIAHSIEKLSLYNVSHGKAVSVGLYETCNIAFSNHFCTKSCVEYVDTLLSRENLPKKISDVLDNVTAKDMANAVLSDKKIGPNGKISVAVPITIGKCVVESFPTFYAEPVFEKVLNY